MNRYSKVCICGNKPNQTKIGGAIFVWLDLLLDAGQLFHKPNQTKIGGAIFVWLDLLLDAGQLFHILLLVIV